MAAAEDEQDLVLKVTLNNMYRFMVVIAKNSSVLDLKSEISKVSRLFSSTDLGEITSVQSCCSHELPNIYKVGRLLEEGDCVQAYTADHVSNHVGSGIDENAVTLESSSQRSRKGSATQNANKNTSDSADTSKDSHQGKRIKKTEDMVVSNDEQECTSKRNEKEDLDKTINTCKDSGSRKGKSRLKTPDFKPVTRQNAEEEHPNKRRKKSSECTEEKSSSQVQELEKNLNEKDGQNPDKIDEHESIQEYNEVHDCEDLRSENEISLKNGKTKSSSPEVPTPRNKSSKERNEGTLNERENLDHNGMNLDSSRENPENRTQNMRTKRSLFQMENFVLQLEEEESCDARAKDGQNKETRLADMRSTQKSESQRTKVTSSSEDPVEQRKESRRKQRHSRTQSIDESLADEDQRNKVGESPSTGSKHSSIVSETIFKSQAFKEMLESSECSSKRRVQAIKKSVTKVATWLVNGDGIEDGTSLIKRKSTEIFDKTTQDTSSDHVAAPRNKNSKNNTSASADIYYEENGRTYPIVDILKDRVLYYDNDSGRSSRLIKESYLSYCQLVIPKLNPTQFTHCVVTSERHKSTHGVSEPPAKDLNENDARQQSKVLCAADCQDANEEDCGYGSHGVIGSSGSEDLFITPILKHLMSYTNEPLPSNVNQPLVHAGKEMDDDESCISTEILDSEKRAHVDRRSSAKKLILFPDTHCGTANETALEEGEDQHTQIEKGQESGEKKIEDDSPSSSSQNERRSGKERVDKGQVLGQNVEDKSASLQFENKRITCKETANKCQELDEQFLEADTNSPLGEEQIITEERVDHRENNSTELQQNVQDAKATRDMLTVTNDQTEQDGWLSARKKKKNKKKSRERSISHGESIMAESCDGSTLSQSPVKHTSSKKNIAQKDYISITSPKKKLNAGCSDEDEVKEDTEHSLGKRRKKKENAKNIDCKGEGIDYSHFDEQTSEKDSEISANKEELTREKNPQKHSANIQTAISEKSTNSPRKKKSFKERFVNTQTTDVVSERCTSSPRKETSIEERFVNTQTTAVVPEKSTNSPRKKKSFKEKFANTDLFIPESSVALPPQITSSDENLTKDKSAKRQKKSSSKNKDISEETLPGGLPDVTAAVELQARGQSAVEAPKDVREQESYNEEKNEEKKKKKKKKKKYKERDKADVSAEEICERKESKKRVENYQECNVDKDKMLSEARALSVEDNCDVKKKKKQKKKRRDKGVVENEGDNVDEEDTTKESSETRKISQKEESEATVKPVGQVHNPVLQATESEKIDGCETNTVTKKSRKRSHKDSEIPSKSLAQVQDKPVLTSLKAKNDEKATEEETTTEKTKKETKRKEKNEDNTEKEDEEIPKKKRKKKRQESKETATPSQKGSFPDSGMFSSCSETERNLPLTNVLSWISKKIKPQTTEESSSKKASKSTLMDLAQDDQKLSLQKTPFRSPIPSFTPRSSSMSSSSRIFHKTPLGFPNTVPRIQQKSKFIPTPVASNRRKRKRSNSLPQRRELTQKEKDILSGGVMRLEELLDNDSVWD